MQAIELKVPGAFVLVPDVEKSAANVVFSVDLARASLGDFVPSSMRHTILMPRTTAGAFVSAARRLIRLVDGAAYVGLLDAREGHGGAADGVTLLDRASPVTAAPGAMVVVPPGVVAAVIALDRPARFVEEIEAPLEPAAIEAIRLPSGPPMPAPRAVLARQRVQAEAPRVVPPEPEPPSPTRAGALADLWRQQREEQQERQEQ